MSARPIGLATALSTLMLAACATAPASKPVDPATLRLPDAGRVAVSWHDPSGFREVSCRFASGQSGDDWVRQLALYTRTQAERRLPEGARLEVDFIDIDRAGECEPARRGEWIRMVRDVYPPRIQLDYRLTGADGQARAEQNVRLTDLGYLFSATPFPDSDPLRYEKRLIDDWLRRLPEAR